ncbi:MAG: hypothetical protein HOK54_02565 [Alphaproteobacteria bacterium]|jgi:hypothetical protein|nr:hypothetical protein [Alphaproteobacteria bacterium]
MYQSQLDVIDLNDDLSGLQSAQFFIEQIEKCLEQLELEVSIKHDFDDWAETARTFASDLGVSRSVDPKRNNFDGFWVEVRERHTGDVIALQVDRLVETDDFIRKWILTGRLFSGKTVNNNWVPQALNDNLPNLSGSLLFLAGMWVAKKYRGVLLFEGLSIAKAVSQYGRCIALTNYYVDAVVAFVEDDGGIKPARGLAHRVPLVRGYYSGRQRDMNVDIHWSVREEMLSAVPELGSSSTRMAINNFTTSPELLTAGSRVRR